MRVLLLQLREKMDKLKFGQEVECLDHKLSMATNQSTVYAGAQKMIQSYTAQRGV
jgi:hypothetical protein